MARVWEVVSYRQYEWLSVSLGIPRGPAAVGQRVANLHSALGQYYVANGNGDGIRVRRADGYTPRSGFGGSGGFQSDVMATSDPADANPALLEDSRHFIRLFFERGGSIYRTSSGNRGATWEAPVSQLPGVLPAAARGTLGQEVLVAVQADNTLLGTVQYTGDRWPNDIHTGGSEGTSSDAPYALLDAAETPLATDGTGVALTGAPDGRIVMAVRIDSETDLSHWWSGDKKAQFWTRVT